MACSSFSLTKLDVTESQLATSQLIVGAFFFACRSCKYLKVSQPETKKTKQLMLGNLAFYKGDIKIPHSFPLNIHTAVRISNRFKTQKNGQKFHIIMQWRTGHPYPNIHWALFRRQILGYTRITNNTKVSTVQNSGKLWHITSKIIDTALSDGIASYGEAKLQIFKHKMGTHSIQSGAAMAMYLGGGARICNHANQLMVIKYIYEINKKTNQRIHFRCVPKNADDAAI
jgi:hypothetical protein